MLRVGTRGSALALWQTERVRRLLAEAGHLSERVEIRTTGDMVQDVPLARIGSALHSPFDSSNSPRPIVSAGSAASSSK